MLKDLHKKGIGATKKQAGVITDETEERLWSENVLGSDTPQKLLDTLVYCLGLNLALRSGKEHRSLQPEMLCLMKEPSGMQYLLYTEWGSKNHTGGLTERKVKNKSVKVFANTKCPERCVVRLYDKYMALRPEGAPSDVFYLRPLDKPRPGCWYTRKPVGHNPLSQTVKKLLENVGVQGYYTNHSLRRTCATRLYQHGADEQQIMAVTGHRSKDGVRNYKEPSLDQQTVKRNVANATETGSN